MTCPNISRRWDGSSEFGTAKYAIEHGLDSNNLWTEEDLIEPEPKGGCVLPGYLFDSQTWPHHNSPLHRTTCFSDFQLARFLLEHGADVDLYNAVGVTPLHEAVGNQNHDGIRFFLANNADVDKSTIGVRVRYKDL
ncbi:hypothetical protein NOF04DRAFT_18080 [Fusarium oxysporum II5]|uniref:Uncharacterized protein n=3 Tax=Fusarium oxysporum species complex TaxID=171631 RepID=X0J4R1_FUSO5|nr:uncharacterized protein FOIG_15580 [Fusarium odoratissimum NRRL 54006]EXL91306.1 hypothetical protein FOIG_15580 [Fusarium odoratissimum NRRL 54006]KAK2132071.1 hypothetical protein NOF04DRAFT_18080 [Fusarium oxysporum II5]TXC09168.1 hypothetical protein FocTR4_00006005 [Fusarium oxysporum f. sp. cubense]